MKRILLCLILIASSQWVLAQTKFDEYGALLSEDESARLYNFAGQLKESGAVEGTLIIYKDKSETTGKFLRHFYGVKSFLIESFSISPEKVSIVFGGESTRRTEMWLSKSKEESSKFESEIFDEKLAGKINRKILFDYNCLDCDESPFVNQFIFREGIDYLAEVLKANPKTKAIIKIAKVEFVSKTTKEKRYLLNEIFDRLRKKQVQRKKVSVQFTSGNWAKFYIIPSK